MWNLEEQRLLKEASLGPAHYDRELLVELVEHFARGGSNYAVSEKGTPKVSKGSGRKIKNAVLDGKLLWLVDSKATPRVSGFDDPPGKLSDPLREQHRWRLVSVTEPVRGLGPPSIHDSDLVNWSHGRDDPRWPVSKGYVYRDEDGTLRFDLNVEATLEWKYIRQHIPQDPLWSSAEVAKETMAGETAARLELFEAVV